MAVSGVQWTSNDLRASHAKLSPACGAKHISSYMLNLSIFPLFKSNTRACVTTVRAKTVANAPRCCATRSGHPINQSISVFIA